MRLTQWSDYSLRVLMYCAACDGREKPVTITEIAEAHGISRSHLMKIVVMLAAQGWIETTRGRNGGLRLALAAHGLSVGTVLRHTETDLALVECFDPVANTCRLDQRCRLKHVLARALDRFLSELDGVTLDQLVRRTSTAGASAALPAPPPPARRRRAPIRIAPAPAPSKRAR